MCLLLRTPVPRLVGTSSRSGRTRSSRGHPRTHARVLGAGATRNGRRTACPSRPSRSSAARSAITRMAWAPSSKAASQGRASSIKARFTTGPRSRCAAAAASRSARAPDSAAAATRSAPSPRSTRNRNDSSACDTVGASSADRHERAHVIREQRECLDVRLADDVRAVPVASSPQGRTPRVHGGSPRWSRWGSWRTRTTP